MARVMNFRCQDCGEDFGHFFGTMPAEMGEAIDTHLENNPTHHIVPSLVSRTAPTPPEPDNG